MDFLCENSLWAKYCVFCNAIEKIQVSCSFLSTLYALRQFERSKNLTFGFLFELVFQSLLSIFIFNISVSFTSKVGRVQINSAFFNRHYRQFFRHSREIFSQGQTAFRAAKHQ